MIEALLQLLSKSGLHNLWRFHLANLPRVFHLVPTVFGVLGFYLFAYVGQLHEIYLALIENDDRLRFLLGLFLVALLSAANFACYLTFTARRAAIVYGSMNEVELPPALLWLRFIAASIFGFLPLFGVAVGVWGVQDLLAQTIHSGWEATRAVPSGGPLAIPGLEQPLLTPAAWWLLPLVLAGLVVVVGFVIIFASERQAAFWSHARGSWTLAFVKAFILVIGVAAAVWALDALPKVVPSGRDADVLLTQVIRVGQYYLAGALAVLFLASAAILVLRNDTLIRRVLKFACIAIAIGAIFILPVLPPALYLDVTQFAGPLAMIAAQCLTVFTVFILLYALARKAGISLVFLLTIAILARTWIETKSSSPQGEPTAQVANSQTNEPLVDGTRAQFAKWIDQREDLKEHFPEDFPVFVIAVQGGGIYAASAAATFLSRLQDICPAFARHVFAISGVSGGAVGAALFNATLAGPPVLPASAQTPRVECAKLMGANSSIDAEKDATKPPGRPSDQDSGVIPQSEALRWVLTRDHLSPVLGMLTSEYADKLAINLVSGVHYMLAGRSFIERPDWDAVDGGGTGTSTFERRLTRAKALEASLSCAVAERPQLSNNALEDIKKVNAKRYDALLKMRSCDPTAIAGGLGPFADQFKVTNPRPVRPALLLNTTFVETGQRVAFSPFPLRDLNDRSLQSFEDINVKKEFLENRTLAEAAVASARFPALMPAYVMESRQKQSWNFVDGGYADNSGAATAVAIVEAIRGAAAAKKAKVRLIVLTNEDPEPDFEKLRGTPLTDTWAPIQAVLNVRSGLASREVARAVDRLSKPWSKADETLRAAEDWRVGIIRLDQTNFSLQLAWTISRTTNLIVSLFVAKPEYCDKPVSPKRLESKRQPTPDANAQQEGEQNPTRGIATLADSSAQDRAARAKEDARLMTRNACLVSDIVSMLTPGNPNAP